MLVLDATGCVYQRDRTSTLIRALVSYRLKLELCEYEAVCRDELSASSAASAHRKKPQRDSDGRGHE